MNISVAGTGYVGLVSAAVLAKIGHHVTCVDVDAEKIALLRRGECPIYESGLPELLSECRERLSFTTDTVSPYARADAVFIAAGTPEKADGSANLTYVFAAAAQIAAAARQDCVVVVKSTVPIGTNERVEQQLQRGLAHPVNLEVVSNPEFLSQGTALRDMLHGNRIVIGAESEHARRVMERIYAPLRQPIVFTNRRSAEMVKYASNDFLALKISYINEIANLCETLGADVEDVARGMGLDPRIGDQFLRAGIGYGGSCFPKDTKALHWLGSFHDLELKTVKAAIEVNENQKLRLLKKARKYYSELDGLTVAVLGLTFKPGTDDLREAPSLANVPILLDHGARVQAWDPCGAAAFRRRVGGDVTYSDTPKMALKDADLCLILTEWPEVLALTPEDFQVMRKPIILDGRNCFKPAAMTGAGLTYDSIGRGTVYER